MNNLGGGARLSLAELRSFFGTLFPDLGGGFIEFRLIGLFGNIDTEFCSSVEKAVRLASEYGRAPDDDNVYFGVCPRSEQKGDKKSVRLVHALWTDLDGKDYAGGKQEALERLRQFHLAPTIIVDSGNGYHAYWRLKTAVKIEGAESISLVERYLKSLAHSLGADTKSAELARILRVPGTLNLKNLPESVRWVTIVELEPTRQWNLADFHPPDAAPTQTKITNNPPGWVSESFRELRDGNRNDTFTRIAGRLHKAGWLPDEITSILLPHAERVAFSGTELRALVEGICRRYPAGVPFPNSSTNREKTETEKPPAEALHVAQLLAAGPVEISWCVEPIIPSGGAAIIGAPHAHGKSWVLLDMAIEGARRDGGKWLGQFPMSKGPVLYIDEESTPGLLRLRISKLLKAKGLSPEDLDLHFCVGQGISLDSVAGVQRLRKVLEQIKPYLVVVDTLIRVHGADENSATDMARVFKNVRELSNEFGCAFAFADHQRKPDRTHSSLDFMLRGSTEKPAFVDTLLSLKKRDQDLIVEHSKSRYVEPVPSFLIRIEDIEEGATAVTYLGDAAGAIKAEKEEAAQAFIDSTLESGEWVSRQDLAELAKEAKVSVKVLDAELARREKDGEIEKEKRLPPSGKGNKAAFYRKKPEGPVIPFPDSPYIERETETESGEHPQ